VVRRDAQRRTVVRSPDLHADLGASRNLCWLVSGRQAYPRYFRRPPNVACSHEICLCVHKYHCRAFPRQQVWFATRRYNPAAQSWALYFTTFLSWPSHYISLRYRRHHADGCTVKVKGKGKIMRVGSSWLRYLLSYDYMYSGSLLLTFRSKLQPHSIVLWLRVVQYLAIDVSEYPTASVYCLIMAPRIPVASSNRFGLTYNLNLLYYESL
jgi:hypothetical protein